MAYQDIAQICKNGHLINANSNEYPKDNSKFCRRCGEVVIDECEGCKRKIKGNYVYDDYFMPDEYVVPDYCEECGEAYPWTKKKKESLKDLLQDTDLSEKDQNDFMNYIDDIISENPRTELAVLKVKGILRKITSGAQEVARSLVIDIASETIKKSFDL
ncbi:MAG: DUF2321 domain-containing protein [Clostridia bacterium]|jgi:hypothetical protein|nr:DUF2321 domain-containing protein [Clostridia bacterium]